MLLPSDVARLVLGYLQEEGLSATSQSFIHESPNLKEYAEHTTVDGTIPACVFSVFGKGLTTILNEYVAAKTKESCHEVPAMMTSLWKKLDFTLNQIKSLQNSPAISASQRTRSRVGLANMARQRVLTVAPAGSVVCSTVSETVSIISPPHTSSHSMLSHSTPVSYTRPAPSSTPHLQNHEGSRLLNTPRDSPVQLISSEHRPNPGPVSPGRRKWKRSSAGSSGTGRSTATVSSLTTEPQPEEVVEENFPQLVIQNARDKILGDRSLQEKLAENINKILANEPTPQTSKAASSVEEPDQSIDEILGLQGEIHMSDDAIHDILEQTESDPAFQALFDLFDYNKTRFGDGEPGDGDISSSPEESDVAGPSFMARPLQSDDPGTLQRDTNASDTTSVKVKAGQERKTRKSTAPALLKKVIVGPSCRTSRIENSSAKLLGVSSASRKEKGSLLANSVCVTPMDIDEPLNTPPPPSDGMDTQETLEPVSNNNTPTTTVLSESTTLPSSRATAASAASEAAMAANVNRKQGNKQTQASKEQPAISSALAVHNHLSFSSPAQIKRSNTATLTADLPHMSVSSSRGDMHQMPTHFVTPEPATSTSPAATATVRAASALPSSTTTAAPGSPTSASTSASLTAASASSTAASPASSSSCAPAAAGPDAPTVSTCATSKAAADSSNIVSLKIIISDNQEEDASSDAALSQAISSISGDKIPTIYLSSPAKSPAVPGTPKASLDEAAQAVSGLQSSEAQANLLSGSKTGAVISSPLTGTSQAQQSYIIQVPLDTTNPSTASYFLVTERPTTDAQGRQKLVPASVSKGPPISPSQFGVTTPTRSQGFSTGSALILPSPVKPMVLPVSVMGQNTLGKVQMVSNQLVAIPNPVQQPEISRPKPPTAAAKQSTIAGTEQTVGGMVVQSLSAENTGQQNVAVGPSHRRILCFDSSGDQPTAKKGTTTPSAACASISRNVQHTVKDNSQSAPRTKPTILGGNKPKRRIETIRYSDDGQSGKGLVTETEKTMPPQQNQKDAVKKSSRKQDHTVLNKEPQNASTNRVDGPQLESPKKLESGRRSKSIDRKHNHGMDDDGAKANDSQNSRSVSSDSVLKSGSRKEKEESSKKDLAKTREGRTEKRTASQEIPNVTANKENEMKGSMQEQQSAPSSSGPAAVTQPTSNPQSKTTKPPSKTSSLAKQAAEMLQDIQGLNSPSTPRGGVSSTDHALPGTPRTGRSQEESADSPRTPSRQNKGKDSEGTPKRLVPPNTSDVPTCSPASEAGSENSINMAAHTLMILSRAAIARTGTPLKDSLRQEGVAEQSPTTSKTSKKRKQSSPTASPPAKKESKRSPSKKKDRERKKLVDCFPHDLDVDKFLSSLHYDE